MSFYVMARSVLCSGRPRDIGRGFPPDAEPQFRIGRVDKLSAVAMVDAGAVAAFTRHAPGVAR